MLFVECPQNATSEISSKNQNSSTRQISRSSRSQIFFKIGILKNFALITGKHLWWSLFSIKLQVWIIKSSFNSLVWLVLILEIIPKAIWNCIIVNPLIRKHVRHLNEDIICYNFSFFIEKSYWNLPSLLHNLVYHIWIHFYSGNLIVKSKLLPLSGTSLEAIESHP